MIRRMKASKSGTVKAVSPWLGLQIMPFEINLVSSGTERTDRPAENLGNVARSMGAGSDFGHGAKITFFQWRQAIEAHAKKTLVQGRAGKDLRSGASMRRV